MGSRAATTENTQELRIEPTRLDLAGHGNSELISAARANLPRPNSMSTDMFKTSDWSSSPSGKEISTKSFVRSLDIDQIPENHANLEGANPVRASASCVNVSAVWQIDRATHESAPLHMIPVF